jgi:hypothetical protein
VQKSPEPVSQIEPQKPQNTVQEIAKQPTKLSEFDMWWFEIGKELFKQAGIVDGPARIAAKAVARAAWNYAASLKQDSAA